MKKHIYHKLMLIKKKFRIQIIICSYKTCPVSICFGNRSIYALIIIKNHLICFSKNNIRNDKEYPPKYLYFDGLYMRVNHQKGYFLI